MIGLKEGLMEEKDGSAKKVPYRTYVFVWIGLLILTWLTVTLSSANVAGLGIITPLAIASVKALLVISFFMHLKYEKRIFKALVLVPLGVLIVVSWLVYSDVLYRR